MVSRDLFGAGAVAGGGVRPGTTDGAAGFIEPETALGVRYRHREIFRFRSRTPTFETFLTGELRMVLSDG